MSKGNTEVAEAQETGHDGGLEAMPTVDMAGVAGCRPFRVLCHFLFLLGHPPPLCIPSQGFWRRDLPPYCWTHGCVCAPGSLAQVLPWDFKGPAGMGWSCGSLSQAHCSLYLRCCLGPKQRALFNMQNCVTNWFFKGIASCRRD